MIQVITVKSQSPRIMVNQVVGKQDFQTVYRLLTYVDLSTANTTHECVLMHICS